MSLTRSLLALAILAAANAECVTKCSGEINRNLLPLQRVIVPPPGGDVTVPIEACANGNAVGECVTVCNQDGAAPSLNIHRSLKTVSVYCENEDCPDGVSVDVTLYCP